MSNVLISFHGPAKKLSVTRSTVKDDDSVFSNSLVGNQKEMLPRRLS
jgi:hypothetical protein